jgi:lipopolysaccharide transport system ATP-binding protein
VSKVVLSKVSAPAPASAAVSPFRRVAEAEVRVTDAVLEYPVRRFRGSLKAGLLRLAGGKAEATPDSIAALKGVSFKVEHGERVGLIGRNGSGKTTLLRALAGVYPLRSGLIEVRGRIRTLLDLRHGFESESTGRENLYYRALALGIAPEEIRAAEAEIIEFADIGKFIDLPISTYSAGMVLRLGFAVSTQFAPDVLLIDEIFAAGDASFSERAVQRMNRILAQSGIMMMASHSMPLMRSICTRVIWLENGEIRMDGEPDAVATAYLAARPERRT